MPKPLFRSGINRALKKNPKLKLKTSTTRHMNKKGKINSSSLQKASMKYMDAQKALEKKKKSRKSGLIGLIRTKLAGKKKVARTKRISKKN